MPRCPCQNCNGRIRDRRTVERHLERSRKIAEESTRNIAAYSHQMCVVDPGDLDLDSEMEDYEESEQSNNQGDQFDAEDTQDELLDQYSQQNHHIDEIGDDDVQMQIDEPEGYRTENDAWDVDQPGTDKQPDKDSESESEDTEDDNIDADPYFSDATPPLRHSWQRNLEHLMRFPSAQAPGPSMASTTSVPATYNTNISSGLAVPPSPLLLDVDDYPDARFWNKCDWTAFENAQNDKGISFPKLRFITTQNGETVSSERLSAMTEEAKKLWNALYASRVDPASWKLKTAEAGAYFSNSMRATFDEFRLCAHDWKVEQFAVIRYPDWAKSSRSSGKLNRTRPSISSQQPQRIHKRRLENDHKKAILRPQKKAKLNEATSAMTTPTMVLASPSAVASSTAVTLWQAGEDFLTAGPTSMTRTPTLTALTPTTTPTAAVAIPSAVATSTAIALQAGEDLLTAGSTSTSTPTLTALTPTTTPMAAVATPSAVATSTAVALQAGEATTPTAAVAATSTAVALQAGEATTPTAAVATPSAVAISTAEDLSMADSTAPRNNSRASAENPREAPSGTPIHSRPCRDAKKVKTNSVKFLAAVVIPAPASDVLVPVTNSIANAPLNASSNTMAPALNVTGKKKEAAAKVMKPTSAITGKNLYATEYLKTHPNTTTVEFNDIYKKLNAKVKKDFNALAKAKKQTISGAVIASPAP